MRKQHRILIILAIISIAVVSFLYFRTTQKYPQQATNNERQTKTFQSSSTLKFSIKLPSSYQPVERLGSVTINTTEGTILIGQNGTNFDNLKGYIINSRNNLNSKITNRKELTIGELEAISGNIGSEKIYFIYAENNVYTLSTESVSLYDELDQIAQSFRYTP